jgi:proteic killer suppression protein
MRRGFGCSSAGWTLRRRRRTWALPGWRLHPLKGPLKGMWAVSVSGNWRLTFAFEGKDAVLVDYQDYH